MLVFHDLRGVFRGALRLPPSPFETGKKYEKGQINGKQKEQAI